MNILVAMAVTLAFVAVWALVTTMLGEAAPAIAAALRPARGMAQPAVASRRLSRA